MVKKSGDIFSGFGAVHECDGHTHRAGRIKCWNYDIMHAYYSAASEKLTCIKIEVRGPNKLLICRTQLVFDYTVLFKKIILMITPHALFPQLFVSAPKDEANPLLGVFANMLYSD